MLCATTVLYHVVPRYECSMSEVAEASDPNDEFREDQVFDLIDHDKFDEAIEFLNNTYITKTNKRAALNHHNRYNWSTLVVAASSRAPIDLLK